VPWRRHPPGLQKMRPWRFVGFRVQSLGFRVEGLGIGIQGVVFSDHGLGCTGSATGMESARGVST
jgi:hypothetical protein